MTVAVFFPGQGSQTSGFLYHPPAIYAVNEILERSCDVLGYDVLTLDTPPLIALRSQPSLI